MSADLQQSKDAVFAGVRRMVARHPWLRARVRLLTTEAVFKDDDGGEHVLRVLPKDVRGIHGLNLSMLIADEVWVHDSWDLLEGVSPSPARRNPLTIWSSYAGLKHQRRAGVPWFDVLTRAQAGDDPRMFLSHVSGRDGALSCPWIDEQWLQRMERQFQHVLPKFQRLALNVWATGDSGSFLAPAEIADAKDNDLPSWPTGPDPTAGIGVDIGLSHDTTAIVATKLDAQSRLIVFGVHIARGTPSKPVSLVSIEEKIVQLATILNTRRIVIDRWQAAMLSERLAARGLSVTQKTSDPANLDRWATQLRRWFSTRNIRIPNHPELLEQLESLEAEELRRRDRTRFTSHGAGRDDAAIALVLSADHRANDVGIPRMSDISECLVAGSLGSAPQCYLWVNPGRPPSDPICRQCAANTSTREAHRAYVERTQEQIDLRTFAHTMIRPCTFVGSRRLRERLDSFCL